MLPRSDVSVLFVLFRIDPPPPDSLKTAADESLRLKAWTLLLTTQHVFVSCFQLVWLRCFFGIRHLKIYFTVSSQVFSIYSYLLLCFLCITVFEVLDVISQMSQEQLGLEKGSLGMGFLCGSKGISFKKTI